MTRIHVSDTPIARPAEEDGPRVHTTAGNVRGVWRQIVSAPERRAEPARYERSAAFYGIPYAESPWGEHRFMAPVPRAPWDGEFTATTPAPTPQRGSIFDDPAIPEPSVPGEDFLTLNVFTPAPGDESAKLPVFVWIHGGGWVSGSHNSPWYDGASFNRDGVVTVSVAYRLGFDGYGYVPGSDAPYNRAVLDQILALEWVRDNIAAFGGDPGNVTIGGQSAGGGNCLVLLTAPRAAGLFHRIISQSGAVPDLRADVIAERSRTIAGMLDVPFTLEGLRTADYDAIFAAQQSMDHFHDAEGEPSPEAAAAVVKGSLDGIGKPHPTLVFGPTVDGEVIAAPFVEALEAGMGGDVAVLAGSTTHDFAFAGFGYQEAAAGLSMEEVLRMGGMSETAIKAMVAERPEHADNGAMAVGDVISDAFFRFPIVLTARARAAAGEHGNANAGMWFYEFSYCSGQLHMATHCTELPFTFDCLADPYCEHTLGEPGQQALADAMHGVWLGFVRSGEVPWEQWEPRSVGRRFGDNRGGELVLERDEPMYVAARILIEEHAKESAK